MSTVEIPKNTQETIRFQITEYRGERYADVRVYYRDEGGELRPTKKGLTLSPRLWRDFVSGVEQLGAELQKCGLLESGE